MQTMQPGPGRQALIQQMLVIAQRDSPWLWGVHGVDFVLSHAWNGPTKIHPIANNSLKYQSINADKRHQLQTQWNEPVLWPLLLLGFILILLLAPLIIYYFKKQNRPTVDKF